VTSRKKNIFLVQLTIFFVAISLLYNTYRDKNKESETFVKIEEEILNREIKLKVIDLIKNKEIKQSYKETIIDKEILNTDIKLRAIDLINVDKENLNTDIKLRAIDLIKNKKISKNFKEINADTAIQVEQLNKLDLEDIWRLTPADDQVSQNLLNLKKKFEEDSIAIQVERLNELDLKDIWELTFYDDQVNTSLLNLKKQFDEDSKDIKLTFEDKESTTSSDTNSFVDIEYSGFDLSGNRYVLESKEADFKTQTPELINMKNVKAKFYLKDNTVLTVTSEEGLYNNITLDMNFKKNVKANYLTHVLLSDILSYSNSSAKLIATGNVRGESIEKGKFSADNVEYDLTGKNLNFSMFGDKQVNIKIKN
jgi:hypothetical protein